MTAAAPAAIASAARFASHAGSSHVPESIASDSSDRSRRVTVRGSRLSSGDSAATGSAGCATPSASRITAVITSVGTAVARSKIRHSKSSDPVAYSLSASMLAWWLPLTTRTAPRSTTSGHRASTSAGDSGRTALNSSMSGSVATGSPPSWRSTDDAATASSATGQDRVRSPRSMMPSGMRPVSGGLHTTLSSVMSPWITWTGRSSARSATTRQAAAAAASTASRRWGSLTWGASTSTVRSACRRSHCRTRSTPGWSKSASARQVRPASRPSAAARAGVTYCSPLMVPPARWVMMRAYSTAPSSERSSAIAGKPVGCTLVAVRTPASACVM